MEDSESDWDSMSEPPVVKSGKPPLSSSSHPDRHNHLFNDQNQPPFDFSNEARVDKKVQEIQPKVAARKIKTYAVSGGKNEKVESRFSSPALKSLKSQQSPSLNPETIQKSKSTSPSQQTDSKILKKSEKISKRKVLEPQETLDDIVNDPLDEDNLNDLSDEGIDNPAFYPEGSFEVEEKYDVSDESRLNREKTEKHKIKPDESIQILPFSDIQTRYFQIHSEPPEVWADRILEPATQCCSWCLGEVFGILKIPFILLFVLVGQMVKYEFHIKHSSILVQMYKSQFKTNFRFLIQAIVAPISNWILKPVIVNTHNFLWMPLCSGLQNLCSLFAQALHPLCLIIKCCPITKHEEQSENVRSLKVV